MLDEGLAVLIALLSGEPLEHEGPHYTARGAGFRPSAAVPVWLAGRFGNAAPLRRAASLARRLLRHRPPAGPKTSTRSLPASTPTTRRPASSPAGRSSARPGPGAVAGPGCVLGLTRVGPYDLDLREVRCWWRPGPVI